MSGTVGVNHAVAPEVSTEPALPVSVSDATSQLGTSRPVVPSGSAGQDHPPAVEAEQELYTPEKPRSAAVAVPPPWVVAAIVTRSASTSPRTNDQLLAPGVGVAKVYVVTDGWPAASASGRWFR